MIYCGTSQKLQIYLDGAVATTELPWILTAITTDDVVIARNGTTNGATAVDGCNAADGLIRHLEVYNADTVNATVYVRYNDNGTTRIIHQETVVPGYTLIYDSESGWAMTPSGTGSAHAAVTLDANADTLLSLSTQALGLDTQAANLAFAGPTTGAAAVPTFRSLVSADIPALAYEASGAIATHAALITGVHGLVFTAGKTLTLTESLTLNALPIGGLAVATSANTLGSLAVGATTQILVGGGTGTVPAWAADLPTAVTIGSAYIYRASGTDVPVADGGTGASTLALNGVLFGNAASAVGVTAIGAQYQVLTVGATPFAPAFSSYLLDGTNGGKTILAVTSTKTLTLTSADNYNLTVPATGTAALLGVTNTFTLTNTFGSGIVVPSLKPAVDSTAALQLQNAAGTAILTVDTTNKSIGFDMTPAAYGSGLLGLTQTISQTGDGGVGAVFGFISQTANIAPPSNPTIAQDYYAINATIQTAADSTTYYATTQLRSLFLRADHRGSGLLPNIYGNYADTRSSGGGTVTTAAAFLAQLRSTGAGSVITNAYGLFVNAPVVSGGGAITFNTGVYVVSQTAGVSGNWALYTNAGLNRLGDQLAIAGSADRTQLTVTGYSTQAVGTGLVSFARNDAAAGVSRMLTLTTLGSGADGDGGSIVLLGKSSTTAAQAMGRIGYFWGASGGATHASRKANVVLYVSDSGGERTALSLVATGTGSFVGVNGVTSPTTALDIGAGAMSITEMTAPDAGAANTVRIYAEDDGAGKTRLMAIFASGAAQQIAIQP